MPYVRGSNPVPFARLKASGTPVPSIPNAQWQANSTQAVVANQVRYNGFSIDQPITVSALVCEVTTTGTATLLRLGLYAADADWQPGALIVDGGTVDATGTGNKSASVSVVLPPGNYLTALNANGTATLRSWRGDGTRGGWGIAAALGAGSQIAAVTATQTFGALPTPGTAFVSGGLSAGNTAPVHVMLMVWSYP